MRERLLGAFLGLTLLTVLIFGVPRAFTRAEGVRADARADVQQSAQVAAEVIALRRQARLPIGDGPMSYLESQDRVELVLDGRRYVWGSRLSPDRADDLTATAALDGGTVVVRRPRSAISQDVVRAITPIVVSGAVALAVAVAAAFLLASRLARPFRQLAASAAVLGSTRLELELPPQRVREAELIAAALRTSSATTRSMLRRERDFARNASHQLRTPLTAMRLRVEDLSLSPDASPVVAQELQEVLGEVDRLSDTVTALLAFARDEQVGSRHEVEVGRVAADAAQRWGGLASQHGRHVVVGQLAHDRFTLARVVVDQVLDVLLDNALRHGAGTVTVEVLVEQSGDGRRARFLVRDEGLALAPSDIDFRRRPTSSDDGEGIGLALCAELAVAAGGRLSLVGTQPTAFALDLTDR